MFLNLESLRCALSDDAPKTPKYFIAQDPSWQSTRQSPATIVKGGYTYNCQQPELKLHILPFKFRGISIREILLAKTTRQDRLRV
jgi:hypothetical protein